MKRFVALTVLLLAGCQSVPMLPGMRAHKIEIQQGNYVTQDMVAKLSSGMSRSQVRFALGTPLIVDPFHADRWDYVYVLQKGGKVIEQRRIVVVFKDDRLVRIDGDVSPAKSETADAAKLQPSVAKPQAEAKPASTPVAAPAQ
jgi:outer membrane protein assembly factor BamE